jgi:hypothetical protein
MRIRKPAWHEPSIKMLWDTAREARGETTETQARKTAEHEVRLARTAPSHVNQTNPIRVSTRANTQRSTLKLNSDSHTLSSRKRTANKLGNARETHERLQCSHSFIGAE